MPGARVGGLPQRVQHGLRIAADLRVVVGQVDLLLAVPAAHRGRAAHPAGVERHDVVVVRQAHELLARARELGHTRAARPAEVHQHRTLAVTRRPIAGERQFECPVAGAVVIQRNGDLAALHVLGHALARALAPGDLLLVEAGHVGLGRSAHRQAGADHGQPDRTGDGAAPQQGTRGQLCRHRCLQGRPSRSGERRPRLTIGGTRNGRLRTNGAPVRRPPVRLVRRSDRLPLVRLPGTRWGEWPISHNSDGSLAFYPVRASARDHVWKAGTL